MVLGMEIRQENKKTFVQFVNWEVGGLRALYFYYTSLPLVYSP